MTLQNLDLPIRIAGVCLILLAILNLFVPRRFGWPAELQRLSLFTRQVFVVHCLFIVLILTLMGILSLFFAHTLLEPSPLAALILGGLSLFWLLRLGVQFFFYSPKLWRGNRFNTAMHVVFSCLWVYLVAVYGTAWALAIR